MKKFLALFLVAVMLLAVLVSCGKKADTPDGEQGGESQSQDGNNDVVDDESESESIIDDKDELPEKGGEYDFNGASYKILSRKTTAYEFDSTVAGGSGGTAVSEAVYKRNASVEDRYNVKISTIQEAGDWGNRADFTKIVQQHAASGYTEIALVSTHSNYLCSIATAGYALDMNSLDFVNYKKEWWSKALYNDCTINGKCFFMIGDIAYTVYERMEVMYFNNTAIQPYLTDYDTLYEYVDEYEWTYDKMMTWAKAYSSDDGAGNVNQYGLSLNSHSVKSLLTAMEVEFTYLDENDRHQLYGKGMLPEDVYNPIDTLIDDIVGTAGIRWYKDNTSTDEDFSTPKFIEGKMLFYAAELRLAKDIAGQITDEWGIVPLPLAHNGQESYHTGGRDEMSGVMVLKNCTSYTMVGLVTEALAMYSYQNIRPAYYETALKGQYAADSETVRMLDFIRNNYKIPFGLAYTTVMGNPYWQIEICYDEGGTSEFYSKYDAGVEAWQSNLTAMYETIDGLQ